MKQEITKKQWDELDNNKKSKLVKTFGWKQLDDSYEYWEFITIGLLIEFLGEDLADILNTNRWIVRINSKSEKGFATLDISEKLELIDALWETTKKKLN